MTSLCRLRKVSIGAMTLMVALFHPRPASAELTAHEDDSRPDRPIVVLETNGLTDGSDPVEASVWERHREPDGGHRTLNAAGFEREDGRPAIIVSPVSRVPTAIWAKATPSGYDIVASRYVAGAWTEPIPVAAGAGDERDPSIAVDSSGAFHLVYGVKSDGASRVEYRVGEPDGTSWSAPSVVSHPGEVAARPSVAASDAGLLVAYESHVSGLGATPRQLIVAERSGDDWSSEVVAETWFASPNNPAIHAEPLRIWLDWIDGEGEMRWTCRDAGGRWAPLDVELFDGVEDRDYHVRGRIKATVRSQR